jgi:SAM-dependent methyltransferase
MERRCHQGRLVYAGREADTAEYWDEHWESADLEFQTASARRGELTYVERSFLTHMTPDRLTLEAGSGTGRIALALQTRGYRVLGVEFSETTVRKAKKVAPEIPCIVGDIFRLPLADGSVATCISLGVMEHSVEGPEAALAEARRVIEPGGALLVSVPHFNSLRRAKARMGLYPRGPAEGSFYQYAFTIREFRKYVQNAGFRVGGVRGYGIWKGLRDEIGVFRWMDRKGWMPHRAASALERIPLLRRMAGHMVLFIAQRRPDD